MTDQPDQTPEPTLPPGGLSRIGGPVGYHLTVQATPDTTMVVLRVEHTAGMTVVGFRPADAEALAKQLQQAARRARLTAAPNEVARLHPRSR